MHRYGYLKSAICLTAVSLACQMDVRADEANSAPPLQGASQAAAAAPAANQGSTAKKPFSISRLPVYLAGIATGACVGMPISLVRRFIWEEKQGIQGLCGDSKNKVAILSAGAFWLPFSAFLGAGEAPVMGPVNSLRHYDKPFSKEQFSLGPIGDSSRDPG